jgi:WD40 repeat protein
MRCLDFNGARGAAVVNINGTVELGPYRGMDLLHAAAKGKLLLSGYSGKELFVLDSATGDIRKICDSKSFAQYASLMPEMGDGTDCDSWSVEHATFSRDGLYIALCVSGSGARHSYLFTFTTTFEDVVFFGRKPMHFNWYDDHSTIYGNDREAKGELYNSVRRWGRDGKWIENLAGSPATHNAMSSDKQLFAGESNYSLPAIDLYVHTRDGKSIKIMSHNFKNVTWDMRAHVNPAFSRDGKRLYFNRATSDAMNEVWYAELAAF